MLIMHRSQDLPIAHDVLVQVAQENTHPPFFFMGNIFDLTIVFFILTLTPECGREIQCLASVS